MTEQCSDEQQQIFDQATDWLAAMADSSGSEEEVAAFFAWLEASERHRQAYREAAALWRDLDRLAQTKLADGRSTLMRSTLMRRVGRTPRRFRARRRWAVAVARAIAIAATFVAAFVAYDFSPYPDDAGEVFETATGQLRTVMLSDGTRVQLNTRTRMSVQMSQQRRVARLNYGQAYFDIASDADRPFVVNAGGHSITAVGTEFDVFSKGAVTDIVVVEGSVRVAPGGPGADAAPATVATEGQAVIAGARVNPLQGLPTLELERRIAWRDGVLICYDQPLADVVDELSRYSKLYGDRKSVV